MEEFEKKFFDLCTEKFELLTKEFGLRKKRKETGGGVYSILFQNKTTAVKVSLEWRDQYLYFEICRLIDGRFPEEAVSIARNSELNCFHIEDLRLIRSPDSKFVLERANEALTLEDIAGTLTDCALFLRTSCKDVLQGDFSVFAELDKVVKRRAKDLGVLY